MKHLLAAAAAIAILSSSASAHGTHGHGFRPIPFFQPSATIINPAPIVVFFPPAHHYAAPTPSQGPVTSQTVYYSGASEAEKAAIRAEECKHMECAKEYPLGAKIPGQTDW